MNAPAAPATSQPCPTSPDSGPCVVCGDPTPPVYFKFATDPPYYLCPIQDNGACLQRAQAKATEPVTPPAEPAAEEPAPGTHLERARQRTGAARRPGRKPSARHTEPKDTP